jgi:D-alanyl-D-alanine-carboxypeptidase/D-alanyl-D-alanine-endopeptidase
VDAAAASDHLTMMNRISLLIVALATAVALVASAKSTLAPRVTSDAEIRELLIDHVDAQKKSLGTVVGILSPKGRRFVSYGQARQGDPRPLDGDTVFEVGSVTKIFTALLLADMVQRGEVALDDPLSKYLPGVKVPERNGRKITLVDLATHTSGLPFFPSDIPLTDPAEVSRVVAKYSVADVHRFLSTFELAEDIGSKWAYSNLGFGLLGEALARRAGKDYETLVRERITGPLGMKSTAITVSPAMKARLAAGYDAQLRPAPEMDMPAFLAAGCLRSTANDLLTLLAAFTGDKKSSLAPAMAAMLRTRRPGPGLEQALAWWIVKVGQDDDGFVAFGGQTAGFASTIAYDPETHVGVVVLSNGTQDDGGLGWHLLRPAFPVVTAAVVKERQERASREITVEPKVLTTYVGRYRVASGPTAGDVVVIEAQADGLIVKSSTTPPQGVRLHAHDERTFFLTEADVQVTFETDDQQHVTGVVIHFAGVDTAAPRVDTAGEK